MAALGVGLLLGVGVFCIWWSFWPRSTSVLRTRRRSPADRLRDDVARAALPSLTSARLLAACVALGAGVTVFALAVTRAGALSVAFGLLAAWAPVEYVRSRARKRQAALRELWPGVVDNIASAVRAGMALPDAVAQIAQRGPVELRGPFAEFAEDYRASGRFGDGLDLLKARLADPVADRLIESLRLAREVGGSELGRLLRTLSAFLREDVRTRAELETRQSWTVNSARLAVAAPWLVLLMLAARPESLRAYARPAGAVVLAVGLAVTVVAYQLMLRIGRLPREERVLR